jgi:hypothetical protein
MLLCLACHQHFHEGDSGSIKMILSLLRPEQYEFVTGMDKGLLGHVSDNGEAIIKALQEHLYVELI